MTLWVPLALAVQSLLIMAIAGSRRARAVRREAIAAREAAPDLRYLIHAINDDRCTGCEACATVCPTNVLALIGHKSRVLRFEDCVQCEACARVCPTRALVMHPTGTEPPPLTLPDIDANFQTGVPGQYLIGEVAGKPLVKNAANLGRFVVEHMVAGGLTPHPNDQKIVDVAIVGSGPGGLSAALTCVHHGLSYVILEKEQVMASTVSRYPVGKPFMAEPADGGNLSFLPVYDTSKEQLVSAWQRTIELAGVHIRHGAAVESVTRGDDGIFTLDTTAGRGRARRVVLAIGTRGKPRSLKVPGEHLPLVRSLLENPADHADQRALVIGGGHSALEAALALSGAGASVTLAYRGRSFTRAKKANKDAIDAADDDGSIEVLYQCNPTEITDSDVGLKLSDDTIRRLPVDVVFVLIGADLPVKWLGKVGVGFVERPHAHTLGATDALIRALVPGAAACPQDPTTAVAVMRGEQLPEPRREQSVVSRVFRRARAASSRWVDSAVARLRTAPPPLPPPLPPSRPAKRPAPPPAKRPAPPPAKRPAPRPAKRPAPRPAKRPAPRPAKRPAPPPAKRPAPPPASTRVRPPKPARLRSVAGTIEHEPTIPFRAQPPQPPRPRRPRATPSPVLGVRRAPTGAAPLEPTDFSTGAQTIVARPSRAATDAERTVVMGIPPEFD